MTEAAATLDRNRFAWRLAAWFGLVLATFYVLFVGGTYVGLADQRIRIVTQVLTVVVLVPWLGLALARPRWRPPGSHASVATIVLGAVVIAAWFSQRPRLSVEAAGVHVAEGLAFLLLVCLIRDPWFRPRIAVLIAALPLVVALGYLVQVAMLWAEWWGLVGRLTLPPLRPADASLTLGGSNIPPAYLVLTAPLGAVLSWSRPGGRWIGSVIVVLSLGAILISASRGGILAAFVAGLTAAIGAAVAGENSSVRSWVRQHRLALVPIGAVALVAGVTMGTSLIGRFTQTSGVDQRIDFWRAAATLFAEQPVTGTGPGTWALLKLGANPAGQPNLVVPHAHNVPIQVLSETGLVGAIAVCLAASWAIRSLWNRFALERGRQRAEVLAAITGLAGFAAQSMVDNLLNLPAVALLMIVVLAWGVTKPFAPKGEAGASAGTAEPRHGRTLAIIGATVAALALTASGLQAIGSAALSAERGRVAADAQRWTEAADAFEVALQIDPSFTLYAVELAVARARAGEASAAIPHMRRVVEEDPYWVHLLSLAWLELGDGDTAAALEHAKLGWQRGPRDANVALNVGALAEASGDASLARDAYLEALLLAPALAGSTYWAADARAIDPAALFADAQAVLVAEDNPLAAAVVVTGRDGPVAGRAGLEALPPSDGRALAIADTLLLEGRFRDATSMVEQLLAVNPRSGTAAAWLAETYAQAEEPDLAERYARWAEILGTAGFASASSAGAVITEDPFAASPVAPNYSWAVYMRHRPYVLVVPGVLAIIPGSRGDGGR